jgi:hypothetical protein
LDDLPGLHRLTIYVKDATDEDLREIGRLLRLNHLMVGWTEALDDYVVSDTRTEIRPVVPTTQVTDAGLAHLTRLRELWQLHLRKRRQNAQTRVVRAGHRPFRGGVRV